MRRNPGPAFEMKRQDGIWLRILEQRLPDGGILTLTSDITEAKKAEKAVKDSETRFRDFAEVASDWFWEMGPDLRFSYFSARYAEITGFPVKRRIGTMRWDHVHPDQLEANAERWEAHKADLDGQHPFKDFEYATTASSEGWRYVCVSGKPVFDDDREFLGYRGIGSDITERVESQVALRNAKEESEYANRAKTDFLANISHELRTPLNSILGFSEVLMINDMEKLSQLKYQEYAKDIHFSGSHLLSLISEVLDLSKLEAGEMGIAEDDINVGDVIKSCIKMVEGRNQDAQTCMSTILSVGLPRLRADELRFKQILINLLGNAVKFTPPDGEITISARVNGDGEYVVEVVDTGVGIAADDIPKVLEPFGQVHDIFTRNHEGSGLGIHLAKSFTELHGGTLAIESTPSKGTPVILTFPRESTIVSSHRQTV